MDSQLEFIKEKIRPYVKTIFFDIGNRSIRFIPIDESDSTLYKIEIGLFELNYILKTRTRKNLYFIWKY